MAQADPMSGMIPEIISSSAPNMRRRSSRRRTVLASGLLVKIAPNKNRATESLMAADGEPAHAEARPTLVGRRVRLRPGRPVTHRGCVGSWLSHQCGDGEGIRTR